VRTQYFLLLAGFHLFFGLTVSADQSFKWKAEFEVNKIIVSVNVPDALYLYKNKVSIALTDNAGKKLSPLTEPAGKEHTDAFSQKEIILPGKNIYSWIFTADGKFPYTVEIKYQGCREKPFICFPPKSEKLQINGEKINSGTVPPPEKALSANKPNRLDALLKNFDLPGRSQSGYLKSEDFISFLTDKKSGGDIFSGMNTLWVIVLVILGGMALNLTPCVLPMIPVNLAIIGAGMNADSKSSGFIRGAVYGSGIAAAYGALGVFAVTTGAKFGTLNASWVFNLIIAVIFILLALAMFDVITIDFSRFSSKIGVSDANKGKLISAFFLGITAALLAGACVAPVVIATLLYSSSLYTQNNYIGLFLPFLLGIGMALPWPIAGAGMSIMPKPGKWMLRVKQFFGIFIIVMAVYYAKTAFGLMSFSSNEKSFNPSSEIALLEEKLAEAVKNNKPVFIDFWAGWCKNCTYMDATTFKDPSVIKALQNFVVIKFQAEKPELPEIEKVLDKFKVLGLPTYIILHPQKKNEK